MCLATVQTCLPGCTMNIQNNIIIIVECVHDTSCHTSRHVLIGLYHGIAITEAV